MESLWLHDEFPLCNALQHRTTGRDADADGGSLWRDGVVLVVAAAARVSGVTRVQAC